VGVIFELQFARRVANFEDAGERVVQVAARHIENLVVLRMLGPGARKAVGLQFPGHGSCGEVRPRLYGVSPLVCQHNRNREVAELLFQSGKQPFGVLARTVEGMPETSAASAEHGGGAPPADSTTVKKPPSTG
jgi:hypothetical protein